MAPSAGEPWSNRGTDALGSSRDEDDVILQLEVHGGVNFQPRVYPRIGRARTVRNRPIHVGAAVNNLALVRKDEG